MATQPKPKDKSKKRGEAMQGRKAKEGGKKLLKSLEPTSLTDWLRSAVITPLELSERFEVAGFGKGLVRFTQQRLKEIRWGMFHMKMPRAASLMDVLEQVVDDGVDASDLSRAESIQKSLAWLLENRSGATLSSEVALGTVALVTCWPFLAGIDSEVQKELFTSWAEMLELAGRIPSEEMDMVTWSLVEVELPLIFAMWVTDRKVGSGWAKTAMESLTATIAEAKEDTADWVRSGARRLRAAIASAVRSAAWGERLKIDTWDAATKKGFAKLMEEAIRWSRKDGSLLLSPGSELSDSCDGSFWAAGYRLAGRPKAIKSLLTERMPRKLIEGINGKEVGGFTFGSVPLSSYSTTAEAGVFQRDWQSQGTRIAVDYSVDPMLLEIVGPKGDSLLAGPWSCSVTHGTRSLEIVSSWQEVCWYTDDEVDYLELEASFEEDCRVQRQVLLIREAGVVLLADALLGGRKAPWRVCSTLPLTSKLDLIEADKTRESWLAEDGVKKALLVPLASGEWKRQASLQTVAISDGLLCMEVASEASNLYMPLAIALKREHFEAPITWRSLTVVENLQIQPSEVAVGYRLQLDRQQWLFYRSLTKAVPRSVLGVHTAGDFCACSFDYRTGDADSLVEVSGTSGDEANDE
jgi:hypothetical protein